MSEMYGFKDDRGRSWYRFKVTLSVYQPSPYGSCIEAIEQQIQRVDFTRHIISSPHVVEKHQQEIPSVCKNLSQLPLTLFPRSGTMSGDMNGLPTTEDQTSLISVESIHPTPDSISSTLISQE